jgi:chemotaxis protein methyltransferase CheR
VGAPNAVADSLPVLRPQEFAKISQLTYDYCGLDLRHGKETLVAARLGKKLRELRMTSFQQYYEHVTKDGSGAAMASMVDQLTTNHTSFFREGSHFDFLSKTIYPSLRARAQVHIWSAACSSGEEPYSIAMSLLEEVGADAAAKVKIKATDISTRVLEKARRGIYEAERFGGLPVGLLQRYLLKGGGLSVNKFRFKNSVRSMIDFEYLNLMDALPESYRCSVIFCRNIMIYFDKPTQKSLVQRLAERLEEGGYLFIGHSESLNGISHGFEYVSPATYRKVTPSTDRITLRQNAEA